MPGNTASNGSSLAIFMVVMLVTGTMNTILMKMMVMQRVPTGPGAAGVGFDHPFFQSLLMMIGEFLCLIAYRFTQAASSAEESDALEKQKVPKHIFAVACLFDWTATTLVNMAYIYIAASVVQMTRGAIVVFTCLLSLLLLGRRQHAYHLVGVAFVVAGITLVSFSALLGTGDSLTAGKGPLLGISLCLGAQVFQATMIVYEEKIMSQYTIPPLLVVGMEGMFGILIGIPLLLFLNAIGQENSSGAMYQLSHSWVLSAATVGSILSIAFFNFAGVTVTQKASAVARSTVDVSRTICIWAIELVVGWNAFHKMQLAGFIVLAVGTLLYNRIIRVRHLEPADEHQKLLGLKPGQSPSDAAAKQGVP